MLDGFACGESDLDDFLRADALRLQDHRTVRTYLALLDGSLVGYMALLADAVVLETRERKRLALGAHDHPSVPALKIARLTVRGGARNTPRHRERARPDCARHGARPRGPGGLPPPHGGRLPRVRSVLRAARIHRDRAKQHQGRTHPSMRLDVFPPVPPAWLAS